MKVADQGPARERQLTVHTRHTATYAECRSWVGSGPLVKSYISAWCRTEYGQNTTFPSLLGKSQVQQLLPFTSGNLY